jgi:hypothetical protein
MYIYKDKQYKGNGILPILLTDKNSAATAKQSIATRNVGIGLIVTGTASIAYGIAQLVNNRSNGASFLIGGMVALSATSFVLRGARAKRADAINVFNAERNDFYRPFKLNDTIATKDAIVVKDDPFLDWTDYYMDGKLVSRKAVIKNIKNDANAVGYYNLYKKNNTGFWVGLGGLGATFLYANIVKGKGDNVEPDELAPGHGIIAILGVVGSVTTVLLTQRGANKSINNGIRVLNKQKPIFYNNKHKLAYNNPVTVSIGMGNYGYGLVARF